MYNPSTPTQLQQHYPSLTEDEALTVLEYTPDHTLDSLSMTITNLIQDGSLPLHHIHEPEIAILF